MIRPRRSTSPLNVATIVLALGLAAFPLAASAQDVADVPPVTSPTANPEKFPSSIAGEFTPARGFDIIKTERGSLNISGYGLFRWLDQTPGVQTFTDHLGRERTVKARNDLNWHRTFIWVTGFLGVPQLRYNVSIWSLATTQQALVFGNLQYSVSRALNVGVGILPNLTNRSTQGSWPFWAATDRQMAEEFFRGGFSSGFWVRGEPVSRFFYTVAINSNLSQLGTTAANDTRDMATSASVWWMPTTGEFGERGGVPDLENHESLATRFGLSAGHSRESRYSAIDQPPNHSQIKLSDGIVPFEANALAEGLTVQTLDYDEMAFDAGLKYRGFSFQGEYYVRKLGDFLAINTDAGDENYGTVGQLPLDSITDTGFMVELMKFAVPKKLAIYGVGGYIWDDFKRNPWEISGGASFYPFGSYMWRLNLHVIRIEKSPTASNFGYYTAGQSGTTISLATDFLF